jgi:hypothetical protein
MIGAEFVNESGTRIPIIITGYKRRGMVEVLAVKHRPFTEYGSFPPQTHAVKRGYVRKVDLTNLRSTRIGGKE